MKKTTLMIIIALSLFVMLFAIDTPARSSSSGFQSGARATFRGSSPGVRYGGGLAKSAARGRNSGWSGYRGGGASYYHRHYHGYYGWGSYWPYWSVGTFFTYLPDDYTIVYVDGTPYYYCDGSYFTTNSVGYVIVPTPEPTTDQATVSSNKTVVAQANSASSDTTTVNVPNSKGGFTPVKLVKHKDGFVGPQGEFYSGHPSIDALKALYGG